MVKLTYVKSIIQLLISNFLNFHFLFQIFNFFPNFQFFTQISNFFPNFFQISKFFLNFQFLSELSNVFQISNFFLKLLIFPNFEMFSKFQNIFQISNFFKSFSKFQFFCVKFPNFFSLKFFMNVTHDSVCGVVNLSNLQHPVSQLMNAVQLYLVR